MAAVVGGAGLVIVLVILWDAFETVILPRRVTRRLRLARIFYRSTWAPWSALARRLRSTTRRESLLSFYGPVSLIALLGVWMAGLILGFALIQWGLGARIVTADGVSGFGVDLYMSGTTLFTLGLGDALPHTAWGRLLTVIEAGAGFALLALVISYLPILYQAFSRRESSIALLDARAGSPPGAVEFLRRCGGNGRSAVIEAVLADWERWSAELLEGHLSYPLLMYYRSQHENQSWLAALTAVLDLCALLLACVEHVERQQAQFTFALARHAAVDLTLVADLAPRPPIVDRLPPVELEQAWNLLEAAGIGCRRGADAAATLTQLRRSYEPFVNALSGRLLMPLPPWLPPWDPLESTCRHASLSIL